MDICHAHNASFDSIPEKPFGIRVRLKTQDSFTRLLGSDWEQTHWFVTEYERDRALQDMSSEHLYSRRGDKPSLIFEPIERTGDR
jgi:hypothetical protein